MSGRMLRDEFCTLNSARCNFYRPQTKLQECNVFTPVCQSFCLRGEGWCKSQHAPGQEVCGWWRGLLGCDKVYTPDTLLPEMATEVGGMHQTRMYSCSIEMLLAQFMCFAEKRNLIRIYVPFYRPQWKVISQTSVHGWGGGVYEPV